MLKGCEDGSDRFCFGVSAPHPPADRPSADRDGRHLERRAGNVGEFHVHFESFCLLSHHPVLSLSAFAFGVWVADKSGRPQSAATERRAESPASSAAISPRAVQSSSP